MPRELIHPITSTGEGGHRGKIRDSTATDLKILLLLLPNKVPVSKLPQNYFAPVGSYAFMVKSRE